jgi:hypothetical protein
MIGFRKDTQDFISPLPPEKCFEELENALYAPYFPGRFIGGGARQRAGCVNYGRFQIEKSTAIPVFALHLTADLSEENGKTKIRCRFSMCHPLFVCWALVMAAFTITAGYVFVVSLIDLIQGSPYSIHRSRSGSWVRFFGLPFCLGILALFPSQFLQDVARDRRSLVNFLCITARAEPVQPPREFRDGFEI